MPIDEPFQPVVTYDGRIIPKPLDQDINDEVIPDPSWKAYLKDIRDGKFEEEQTDGR
jgi:hypothetical protein